MLESQELDANDMVCDFKIVKAAVGEFLDSLDHAMCMNTDDPAFAEFRERYGDRIIGFDATDPTTEVIAKHIHDEVTTRLAEYRLQPSPRYPLAAGVNVRSVKVWETSSSWAEYLP